jgi:hypothetical protein
MTKDFYFLVYKIRNSKDKNELDEFLLFLDIGWNPIDFRYSYSWYSENKNEKLRLFFLYE